MNQNKVQFVVEAVDKASTELDKVSWKVEWLWKQSSASKLEVAAAASSILWSITMIWTNAVNTFADFEKTMSGVKAVLTPTQDEFQKLSDKARELWRSTQYSAQESALAIEMLAKNGLDATQIMNGAIDATLSLASATWSDLSTAADIATSAMLSFWLQTKDLNQVVNSITWTTNVSKFWINDYALALAQGWGVAKTVGVSFKDFNTTIAAISPLFQSWSDAGTSLKTMLLRLVPSSNNAADAMKELWIITEDWKNQFFDATGKMKSMSDVSQILQDALKWLSDEQKNQYLNTIFWTDAMRAAAWMAEVWSEKFTQMQKAIEWTSAADNAITRMNNLRGSFEQLSGAIDDILISMWQMLAPVVRIVAEVMTVVANKVSEVFAWFQTLSQPIQNVVKILWSAVIIWTALSAWLAILTVALSGVGVAFASIITAALPFIAIFWAIGVAVYKLKQDYDNNIWWMKDKTDVIISSVTMKWNEIKPVFEQFSKDWVPKIVESAQWLWENLSAIFKGIFEIIRPIVVAIYETIKENWDRISQTTKLVFDAIVAIIKGAIEIIRGVIDVFSWIMTGNWSRVWDWIKRIFENVWNVMISVLRAALSLISSVIDLALSAVFNIIKNVFQSITWYWQGSWDRMKQIVSDVWNWIKSVISSIGSAISSVISSMLWWITNWFSNAFNSAKWIVSSIMWSIQWVVQSGVGSILSIINGMRDAIQSAVSFVSNSLNTVTSAYNKITSTASSVASSASNLVSKPFRALWWPVAANQPYIVGEKWIEVVVPNTASKVISNSDLQKWIWWWWSLSINFGNVTLNNWLDLEDLADKIKSTIYEEQRRAQLWFI